MKKIEFSKKIVIVFAILEIFVVLFSCFMMYKTMDLTPLMYLIPGVSVVGATGAGFYFNKAKLENKIKLMHLYDVELTEQSFNNNDY